MLLRLFFFMLVFVLFCSACQQKPKAANEQAALVEDAQYKPTAVQVAVSGTLLEVPDSTEIVISNEQNAAVLTTKASDGQFTFSDKVNESGLYSLVIGEDRFPFYLEDGYTYTFEQPTPSSAMDAFATESKAHAAFVNYKKAYDEERKSLDRRIAALPQLIDQNAHNNDLYWKYGEELQNKRMEASNFQQIFAEKYIPKIANTDDQVLIPYLVRETKISKGNYADFAEQLNNLKEENRRNSVYVQATHKVNLIREFYENMPAFPDIHPRNPSGDSLFFEQLEDRKAVLVFFYARWNPQSKDAIAQFKKQEKQLKDRGIETVFMTWDDEFSKWETYSNANRIGRHNYRLNHDDKNFMINNYSVSILPHLMLIDAQDRSVIQHKVKDPDEAGFLNDVLVHL